MPKYGWDTWIRTREWRHQKPLPYRLAISQQQPRLSHDPLIWCGRRDLNSHTLRRQNLNLVRLPISPLPHFVSIISLKREKMVRAGGFEPPTAWFVARYSIQLSYARIWLGYLDSNQGMAASKAAALPLGDIPTEARIVLRIQKAVNPLFFV